MPLQTWPYQLIISLISLCPGTSSFTCPPADLTLPADPPHLPTPGWAEGFYAPLGPCPAVPEGIAAPVGPFARDVGCACSCTAAAYPHLGSSVPVARPLPLDLSMNHPPASLCITVPSEAECHVANAATARPPGSHDDRPSSTPPSQISEYRDLVWSRSFDADV